MDALVADRVTKRAVPFFLLVLEIMWAKVVWKKTTPPKHIKKINKLEHEAGLLLGPGINSKTTS